jgi:hypothetical protein
MHYLAMEYVEGSDLASIVKEHGPLEIRQAVECILQAARGLQFAHEQGIVHRDIKPGNLLLDKEGTVKILDMGLARIAGPEAALGGAERLTTTGQVMGTCDYMAPEQSLDTHQADARADIYSLGCTLYRLLTGNPPYRGETFAKLFLMHLESPIPSLCQARPEVPEALDAICQRMLAKKPEDRYQSMAEVAAELEAVLAVLSGGIRRRLRRQATSRPARSWPGRWHFCRKLRRVDTLTRQKKSTADQRTQPHNQPGARDRGNLLGKLKRAAGMARRRPLLLLGIGPGLVVLLVVVLVLSLRHGTPVVEIDEDLGKDIGKAAAPSTGQHYALELDGRTGYVELPFCYDGTHPVTVEATVVPSPRMPNKVFSGVVSCQGPGGLYLGMDEGRWRFLGWNDDMQGCPRAESDEQPKFGAVQHLAGVFDGQSLIIFMNGRRATNPGNFVRTFKGHSPNFLIGATPRFKDRQLFAIDHFGGIVAEVRVSRVVRYTMDFTPQRRLEPDRDTIALYHFDEGEGNVAHDASGNGNHGKLHGSYRFVRASVLDQSRNDSPPPAIAPFDAAKAKEHQAAWARQLGFPVEMTNSIGMKLVLIPPGEFTMGGGGGAHKVTITKAFCLGKYEVTQEEWEAVMGRGNNPSSFKGPKNPVEQVSWEDCQFFLKKLGEKCGAAEGSYRLPTEAQWEYACRAGSTGGFCSSRLVADPFDAIESQGTSRSLGQASRRAGRDHQLHRHEAGAHPAGGVYDGLAQGTDRRRVEETAMTRGTRGTCRARGHSTGCGSPSRSTWACTR